MSGLEAPLEFGLGEGLEISALAMEIDPPGTIGLVDDDPVVLLRLDEEEDAIRPKDAAGSLKDLDVTTGLVMPAVDDGVLGRARRFSSSTGTGLVAQDIESGASLLTRDMTIQVVLSWNATAQTTYGSPGVIVQRGLGFASGASETRCYSLVIDPTDQAAGCGLLQWQWQDVAGVDHAQAGAVIRFPSGFTMLTATRRWVSPTKVIIRYYAADQFIGEDESADGSIGGATTGTMQIGCSASGGGFGRFFVGAIDELLIVDREMTLEEIQATWLRITKYQPLGEQLFLEMHDRGFPISPNPTSDHRLDIRMVGHSLGFAAAQVENMRSNFLPGRAYGQVLDDWRQLVSVTPQPADGIDQQRSRTVAKMRQRRGVSTPGLQDALADLLGGGSVDDLEFLAFDNTVRDDFSELSLMRWDVTPGGSWDGSFGTARASPGAGTYLFTGATKNWWTARQSIGGAGKQAHNLCKVAMTTPQANLECGIFFSEVVAGDYLLLGLLDDAGTFKIVSEKFSANVSGGVTTHATLGGNPANLWLHLYQTAVDGTWKAAWSTTSATSGFTTSSDITHPTTAYWSGIYVRSTGAIAGASQVDLEDSVIRSPFGTRPMNAYVLLDESLGFSPDIDGANSVIRAIRHAYTHAAFIVSKNLLCDNQDSGCDSGCMGGI